MITKSFALIFHFLLSLIIANASSACNESILIGKGNEILSDSNSFDIVVLSEGQDLPIPQFNSNKAFVYEISHLSDNYITYTFYEEYTVTAIGIRQLFKDTKLKEICPKSNSSKLESIYIISYKVSSDDEFQFLDYPIGTTGMGRLNPRVTLPYQKISDMVVTKETLKMAINPIRVRTIKIQKEIDHLDGVVSNGGKYCLQFEFYGCKEEYKSEPHSIVLEYQMPEPADSSDNGYTGLCSENYCTGGVGKLVDKSTGGISETVFWDTNGPEIVQDILVGNRNLSTLKFLFIFDDVYYIEQINIFTFTPIDFAFPMFISVNGILFETVNEVASFRHLTLSPWIYANSVLLEFYFDADENKQRIAISEVSFVEYEMKSDSPVEVNNMIEVITLSGISVLLFILLGVSVTANFVLFIKKKQNKRVLLMQPSNVNHYNKQKEDETSNYETIPGDRSRYSTVYSEPDPELPTRPFNPLTSVIEMPNNPTYVTTLPEHPDENLPGYSKLDFSKQVENTSDQKNEDVVMRERPKSGNLSAAQRRSSYFEQHMLSDLK